MASLNEIRRLIIDSDRERDWHNVITGPYFTDAPDIDDDTFRQHSELIVFKADVDLTIQYGLEWGHLARDLKRADRIWDGAHFPDESAKAFYADVFWRGTLVDRVQLVAVDGFRATLPLGTRRSATPVDELAPGDKVTWSYTATEYETALARVVDGGREFERYFRETGLKIKG